MTHADKFFPELRQAHGKHRLVFSPLARVRILVGAVSILEKASNDRKVTVLRQRKMDPSRVGIVGLEEKKNAKKQHDMESEELDYGLV